MSKWLLSLLECVRTAPAWSVCKGALTVVVTAVCGVGFKDNAFIVVSQSIIYML